MTGYRRIEHAPLMKYGAIMADNPWRFQNWGSPSSRSAEAHYSTMSTADIMALPVRDLAAGDCWLWLWATAPMLPEALEVVKAWGFRFVSSGHWTKVQKHDRTKPKMGGGHTFRECGEPFILAKIGDPPVMSRGVPGVIMDPRREHSRKPEAAYRNFEKLVGPHVWKLDLFSRQEREGWDCVGDEFDKFPPLTEDAHGA